MYRTGEGGELRRETRKATERMQIILFQSDTDHMRLHTFI